MPTYAYQCKDCAYAFDIVQSFSEDSLTVCPQCQGTLRKKFGNVGVTFKGSGFYRTDSRSSSSSSTGGGSGSASGSESGSPSSASGPSSGGEKSSGASSSSKSSGGTAKSSSSKVSSAV